MICGKDIIILPLTLVYFCFTVVELGLLVMPNEPIDPFFSFDDAEPLLEVHLDSWVAILCKIVGTIAAVLLGCKFVLSFFEATA